MINDLTLTFFLRTGTALEAFLLIQMIFVNLYYVQIMYVHCAL